MNDNARATADRDARLDHFAAELTRAAYHVALRPGAEGTWLDLQLAIWRAGRHGRPVAPKIAPRPRAARLAGPVP
jgi:hypothetical protein